jgi:hypothetical protein
VPCDGRHSPKTLLATVVVLTKRSPPLVASFCQVITAKTHMVKRHDSNGNVVMREEPVGAMDTACYGAGVLVVDAGRGAATCTELLLGSPRHPPPASSTPSRPEAPLSPICLVSHLPHPLHAHLFVFLRRCGTGPSPTLPSSRSAVRRPRFCCHSWTRSSPSERRAGRCVDRGV